MTVKDKSYIIGLLQHGVEKEAGREMEWEGGLWWVEGGYRKFLSEEPHVGHPIVDLAQHAFQILTGYPKHIHRSVEKKNQNTNRDMHVQ